MGAGFVRRRMQAELGPGWRERFSEFDLKPAAAASLGQVHRARSLDGEPLACKLQYPEMASAVETDLSQLDLLFSLHRRIGAAIDTREIAHEIRERVREELDYHREAKVAELYGLMLADRPFVHVPARRKEPIDPPAPDAAVARRRAAAGLRERARRRRATPLRSASLKPGGAPSCATGSSTAIPISAIMRSLRPARATGARSKGSTSSTTAACASFRRASCAGWSNSIWRCARTTRPISRRPMRCGASPSSPAARSRR